jgi:hypothetical protein
LNWQLLAVTDHVLHAAHLYSCFITLLSACVPYLLQFEKAENKPVVIGWVSAAVAAFFVAEWLIHLPALDVVSCSG